MASGGSEGGGGGRGGGGGGGGGGGLSAEQMKRMAENKRKAQERLALKRGAGAASHGSGRINPTSVYSTSSQPPSGRGLNIGPPSSKHQVTVSSSSDRTSSSSTSITKQSNFYSHPTKKLLSTATTSHRGKSTTSIPSSAHQQSSRSVYGSGPATAGSAQAPARFTQLQRVIQATLTLISRTKFKVVVPYDGTLIEIFKKIPSRNYDAKSAIWSFGIEDYGSLVSSIQKECKHVKLGLIPRHILNCFLSHLRSESKEGGMGSKGKRGVGPKGGAGPKRGAGPVSSEVDWSHVEPKIASTLMQFQRKGVEFGIKHGGRVLLADDMGLGKTIQAIAVMSYYRSDWPLLVICPSSVRLTWAEAFKRWLPSLSEEDINVVLTSKSSATNGVVNIISYDLLVKMATDIRERGFKVVIADESHFLKNYKTARCKAALPILKSASHALLLSGTPALSRPIELYTQITAVDKSFRVTLVEFGQRYCAGVKSQFGWDFSGASNMAELQLYMEDQLMIRRLKSEVLDQLPAKLRQMVLLDPSLTKAKSKDLKEMRTELDRAGTLKALKRKEALLPLFEKTGRMKIPAVKDYLLDLLEGGRKVIVFGHHRSVLDSITDCLTSKSHKYIRIDGRTPSDLRQTLCDKFQYDENCLVAVLSITAAGTGLTLTAASTVVFAELFWNPGILIQAEDRAYRIGQKNSVNVHYLVAKNTADDFIWPLVQSKLDVLSQAGLAKDDFSSADSKVLKDISQRGLLECFDELMAEVDLDQLQQEGMELGQPSFSSALPPCAPPSLSPSKRDDRAQQLAQSGDRETERTERESCSVAQGQPLNSGDFRMTVKSYRKEKGSSRSPEKPASKRRKQQVLSGPEAITHFFTSDSEESNKAGCTSQQEGRDLEETVLRQEKSETETQSLTDTVIGAEEQFISRSGTSSATELAGYLLQAPAGGGSDGEKKGRDSGAGCATKLFSESDFFTELDSAEFEGFDDF